MAFDHLNVIERKLIDNLRSGKYNTTGGIGAGSAWSTSDITVFGQFPTTDETKYPCIIAEMTANGMEEQFMGQELTFGTGTTNAVGELYGVGFNIHIAVDRDSSITGVWTDTSVDTAGSTTCTMGDTAQLTVGTTVSGSDIAPGTTVASVTNSTTFELSATATGTSSNITATFSAPFKERRLINFLMLNCANVIMDCDFNDTTVEMTERHYSGFRDIGYNPQLEIWAAICSMVVIFKNYR
jgi:opacity protein-like surface antigen